MPEREEVDRRPADDLVRAQRDREERVHAAPSSAAGDHPDERARASRSRSRRRPRRRRTRPSASSPRGRCSRRRERSEKRPPSDAKTSGVAKRSVAREQRAPDDDRFEVARRSSASPGYPMTSPSTPAATAYPPIRRSPRIHEPMPMVSATRPITTGHDRAARLDRRQRQTSATPSDADERRPAHADARAGSRRRAALTPPLRRSLSRRASCGASAAGAG